jgi:hypothetical protein
MPRAELVHRLAERLTVILTLEPTRDGRTPAISHRKLALVYEFCGDTMRTVRQVAAHLAAAPEGYRFGESEVRATLKDEGLGTSLRPGPAPYG